MEPAEEDGAEESYVSIDLSDAAAMSSLVVETVEVSTSTNPEQIVESSEVVMSENGVVSNMDKSLDNNTEGEAVVITEIVNSDTTFWEVFLDDCRAFENCTIYTADGKFRFRKLLYDIFRSILSFKCVICRLFWFWSICPSVRRGVIFQTSTSFDSLN